MDVKIDKVVVDQRFPSMVVGVTNTVFARRSVGTLHGHDRANFRI